MSLEGREHHVHSLLRILLLCITPDDFIFLCKVWSGGLLPSAIYTTSYLLQIHLPERIPFFAFHCSFAIIHIIVDVGVLF